MWGGSDTVQQSALAPSTCMGSDCTSTTIWGADVGAVAFHYVPWYPVVNSRYCLTTLSGSIPPTVHGWGGCLLVVDVVR
jgi:hypothetical protein